MTDLVAIPCWYFPFSVVRAPRLIETMAQRAFPTHQGNDTEKALGLKCTLLVHPPWTTLDLRIKAPLTRSGVCGHREIDSRACGVKEGV